MISRLPKWDNNIKTHIKRSVAAKSLENYIFKEYLNKLDTLDSNELSAVLISYSSIERAIEEGDEFIEYVNKNVVNRKDEEVDNELLDKHAESLHSVLENAKTATSIAFTIFVRGREDLLKTLKAIFED